MADVWRARRAIGQYRLSGRLRASALTCRLISLVGVKWSCLRMNKPAFPPVNAVINVSLTGTAVGPQAYVYCRVLEGDVFS